MASPPRNDPFWLSVNPTEELGRAAEALRGLYASTSDRVQLKRLYRTIYTLSHRLIEAEGSLDQRALIPRVRDPSDLQPLIEEYYPLVGRDLLLEVTELSELSFDLPMKIHLGDDTAAWRGETIFTPGPMLLSYEVVQ